MGEQRWTRGPWAVVGEGEWAFVEQPIVNQGYPAGRIRWVQSLTYEHRAQAEPDAHLIAAAPDLARACARALVCLTGSYEQSEDAEAVIADLRAALAKAEGRR